MNNLHTGICKNEQVIEFIEGHGLNFLEIQSLPGTINVKPAIHDPDQAIIQGIEPNRP